MSNAVNFVSNYATFNYKIRELSLRVFCSSKGLIVREQRDECYSWSKEWLNQKIKKKNPPHYFGRFEKFLRAFGEHVTAGSEISSN